MDVHGADLVIGTSAGAAVRRRGATLLLFRPMGSELRHHGFNILSRSGSEAVMAAAYEAATRMLSYPHIRRKVDVAMGSMTAGGSECAS